MTIDDLPSLIPAERADLQSDLSHWIAEWKRSVDDIERLRYLVDKWLGNVWLQDEKGFLALMQAWQSFKTQSFDGIGGFTVNERLYVFGLLEIWDASGPEGRQTIMAKVLARA